jgi:hypothetical protein
MGEDRVPKTLVKYRIQEKRKEKREEKKKKKKQPRKNKEGKLLQLLYQKTKHYIYITFSYYK